MNPRVRELVNEAIADVDVVYEGNVNNEELAKMYIPDCFAQRFAELIAEECAGYIVAGGYKVNFRTGGTRDCTREELGNMIIRYFKASK